ncbi:MAG: SMC family ATPase [Acidimicrobiia bacterium]|nr:SMC family ATPase [Acidimicrobiia bacterium]
MRPLRLEMEGFATFRESTTLDFGDLDLVAFVGATGAGKSTIIDAITFALYGTVARYDNAKVVAPVIHQLSTEAKVRLDFDVGGQHYVAVRVVRRRGTRSRSSDSATGSTGATGAGATTKEARLERLVGGDSAEVLAGNVSELDAAVNRLLGLDFGQFTRTVVLPQGQFAQFLRDEPSNRQKLLRSLLELDVYYHMGVVAREEAKRAGQQAEALESELDRQAPVTDTDLERLAQQIDILATLRQAVAQNLEELTAVDGELDPVRDQVNEIDSHLERLGAITIPEGLAETNRLLVEAAAAVAELETERNEVRAAWEREQAALEDGPDRAELQQLLNQISQLADIERERAAAETAVAELTRKLAQATAHQRQSEAEAATAREALAELRRSADAEVWLDRLVEGEPCPICRQTVESVPDHLPDGAVAEAESRAEAAVAAAAEAATEASSLKGSLRAATDQAQRLGATTEQLAVAVDGRDRAEIEAALAQREQRSAAARAAYGQLSGLDRRLDELQADRRQLDEQAQRWNVDFSRQRDQVSGLEPPPVHHQSLLDDWTDLAGWASGLIAEQSRRRTTLAERGKTLAERRRELLAALSALVEPHDITPDPADVIESVAVARSEATGRLRAARERQQEQQELRDRIDELAADREINRVLGQHLSATGFEGWLLNEALDNIVTRASGWLRDLSGGAYSLAVANRDFAIIDHNNADEQRDVRTLSGGETFLTSLSLALALADSIAELAPVDAPRLESMFLDEGFGTLDGATLDVVASAIEELASTGRMIGIVTHVRDLAERLPARFEVSKTVTGSSAVLVQT